MDSARKRAEEWLAGYDAVVKALPPGSVDTTEVRLLRALLASEPAKGADMSRAEGALAAEVRAALNVANGRWYEWGERAKSVEEILLAGLRGYERAATDDPAPPAPDAVREAAEAFRAVNSILRDENCEETDCIVCKRRAAGDRLLAAFDAALRSDGR